MISYVNALCVLPLLLVGFACSALMAVEGAHKVGMYDVSFTEKHPMGKAAVISKRCPTFSTATAADDGYKLEEESFKVFVPSNYTQDKPFGIMVFISAGDGSFVPMQSELTKRQMIGVCAANSGNKRPTWFRMHFALDAVHNLKQRYNIDDRRVIVAGFSGGGRVSSHVSMSYPDIFKGAIYFMGCNFQAMTQAIDKKSQERVKFENRYVFVTGETDFNNPGTRSVKSSYDGLKFRNTTLIDIPGLGHSMPKAADDITNIFDALDKPLIDNAQAYFDRAQAAMKKERLGEALFYMCKAYVPGVDVPIMAEAQTSLKTLEEGYASCLADIETAVNEERFKDAKKLLRAAKKTYKGVIDASYKQRDKAIKAAEKAAKKK